MFPISFSCWMLLLSFVLSGAVLLKCHNLHTGATLPECVNWYNKLVEALKRSPKPDAFSDRARIISSKKRRSDMAVALAERAIVVMLAVLKSSKCGRCLIGFIRVTWICLRWSEQFWTFSQIDIWCWFIMDGNKVTLNKSNVDSYPWHIP